MRRRRRVRYDTAIENFLTPVYPRRSPVDSGREGGVGRQRDGHDHAVGERRTTLAPIAAEAGVSLPTVSKVVNGRPDVAPSTRARVERLLDQHQYRKTGLPAHRRSGLIDLVFAGLDSPWAVEILRGVEEWGAEHSIAIAVS